MRVNIILNRLEIDVLWVNLVGNLIDRLHVQIHVAIVAPSSALAQVPRKRLLSLLALLCNLVFQGPNPFFVAARRAQILLIDLFHIHRF